MYCDTLYYANEMNVTEISTRPRYWVQLFVEAVCINSDE